jgi:two-component system chemotaxis sensor kinase CheA
VAEESVLQIFIDESSELVQEMEDTLLQLEDAPDDQDTINALFRAVHTIKGSSAMVGIDNIEKFTHKIENVLEQARQGKTRITNDLIGLLLQCKDHIESLIESLSSEKDAEEKMELEAEGKSLLEQVSAYLTADPESPVSEQKHPDKVAWNPEQVSGDGKTVKSNNWHISLRFGQTVMQDGMDPASFIAYLTKLGEIVSITTLTDAVPQVGEMDPESCYLGFEIEFSSDSDKQTIEDVFEFVSDDCKISILPPHSKIDQYIRLINNLSEDPLKLGEILINGGALTESELREALMQQTIEEIEEDGQKRPIGEILVSEKRVSEPVVNAAIEKQNQIREFHGKKSETIRVDTDKLDQLINMVGELVIANANIDQQSKRIGDNGLLESASTLSRLVEDIRDRAMKVRMVPVSETFNRFQRVVRDISRSSGKDIELLISGGETELDKGVAEKIVDPLMHLIRNSADHGIEGADVRLALNKPEKGTIHLDAYQETGSIVIKISDDGSGLNKEKILDKAEKCGLISPGQELSDREIYNLIFEPGFSTAEKITNVSGRGVGMDVVKRNIETLRGSVNMESRDGTGTTVQIRLPLTMAIIDGFMVKVGESFYIIPLDMLNECLELTEEDRDRSIKLNYLNLRNEVVPFLRLRDLFDEQNDPPLYEHILVVHYAGQKTGLLVDELHGEVQAVIKSLGSLYKNVNGISGATILGDGTVALILDVPQLVKTAEQKADVT